MRRQSSRSTVNAQSLVAITSAVVELAELALRFKAGFLMPLQLPLTPPDDELYSMKHPDSLLRCRRVLFQTYHNIQEAIRVAQLNLMARILYGIDAKAGDSEELRAFEVDFELVQPALFAPLKSE
eukprot:scaffold280592_cov39-Prasinocladus_malaysianus.AAC.1